MLRSALTAVSLLLVAMIAGCGGSSGGGGGSGSAPAKYDGKPVTISFWSPYTARELGVFKSVVNDFHKAHPTITVKVVGGINDDKIVAATRGGNPPDLALSQSTDNTGAFCGSGAWIDLTDYMSRDHVDVRSFPKAAQDYTTFDNKRCALPVLADVYGLYYNKAMFKQAGIAAPPKTMSELDADAKKLTQTNADGSIKVAGYVPLQVFYESVPAHYGPLFDAQWNDESGKSSLASNPGWAKMLRWQKGLIDSLGYDKLTKFASGAGEEFSASNAFERGKLAMNIDGEYRTAFLKDEHPELDYGTAPMPVDDSQPDLYGGGYVTGNIVGIPKGGDHQAAAWELLKYLATNNTAMIKLADGLKNMPTTNTALKSPTLKQDPRFATFLGILASPHTQTNAPTAVGSANQELFQNFISKWQAGKVPDSKLADGLKGVDQQIDAQTANATAGSAP
jgi:multiple sugar transport system substrate-binding protein